MDLLTNRLKEWLEKHVEVIRPSKDRMSRRVLLKEVDRLSGFDLGRRNSLGTSMTVVTTEHKALQADCRPCNREAPDMGCEHRVHGVCM